MKLKGNIKRRKEGSLKGGGGCSAQQVEKEAMTMSRLTKMSVSRRRCTNNSQETISFEGQGRLPSQGLLLEARVKKIAT